MVVILFYFHQNTQLLIIHLTGLINFSIVQEVLRLFIEQLKKQKPLINLTNRIIFKIINYVGV